MGQVRPILAEPLRPVRTSKAGGTGCRPASSVVPKEVLVVPGLALIAATVWGAAGALAHSPDGDPTGRQRGLAVLVSGGRVAAVVPAAEAGSLGADPVVHLGDAPLMPGFVDAHVHLTTTGLRLHGANLHGARSAAEML